MNEVQWDYELVGGEVQWVLGRQAKTLDEVADALNGLQARPTATRAELGDQVKRGDTNLMAARTYQARADALTADNAALREQLRQAEAYKTLADDIGQLKIDFTLSGHRELWFAAYDALKTPEGGQG